MGGKALLIIANVLSLIGNTLAAVSAILKTKRNVLLVQSSNHFLEIIAQFMTAAYSGMVQEVLSLTRNVVFLFVKAEKKKTKLIISVLCVLAGLVGGIVLNVLLSGNVLYGYLPIVATTVYGVCVILSYTLKLETEKGELLLKSGLLFNVICWAIYSLFVKLYPGVVFNCISVVFCVYSIIRILTHKKPVATSSASATDVADDVPPEEEKTTEDEQAGE